MGCGGGTRMMSRPGTRGETENYKPYTESQLRTRDRLLLVAARLSGFTQKTMSVRRELERLSGACNSEKPTHLILDNMLFRKALLRGLKLRAHKH